MEVIAPEHNPFTALCFRAGAAVNRQRNRRNAEHLDRRQPGHKVPAVNGTDLSTGQEDKLVAMHHLPGFVHVLAKLQQNVGHQTWLRPNGINSRSTKTEQEGGRPVPAPSWYSTGH